MTIFVVAEPLNMKYIFCLLLPLLSCTTSTPVNQPQERPFTVAKEVLDLNNDQLADTILMLDTIPDGDPGSFAHIQIRLGGNKGSWEKMTDEDWDTIPREIRGSNDPRLRTPFVWVKTIDSVSYLLFIGFQYGAGRERQLLLRAGSQSIRLISNEVFQEIAAIEDADANGELEFVGKLRYTEGLDYIKEGGYSRQPYNPFLVCDITQDGLRYNLPLSEKYNKAHYVWAGRKNEKAVVRCWWKLNKYELEK